MARAMYVDAAIDQAGNALPSASVSVFERGTTLLQTIYTTEAGGTTKANPFVVTDGNIFFWAPEGAYDVFVHDTSIPIRVADRTMGWDAIPLASVAGLAATVVGHTSQIAGLPTNRVGVNSGRGAPNAYPIGSTYFSTDVGGGTLYETNGTSWIKLAPGVSEVPVIGPNTIISSYIVDGTIVPGDMNLGAGGYDFNALRMQGRLVETHPYGGPRHIETGSGSLTDSGGGGNFSASFTDPYAAGPNVVLGSAGNHVNPVMLDALSTTGLTVGYSGWLGTYTAWWLAEGPD